MLAARAVLKRAAVVVAARAPTTKVAAVPVRLFSEAKDAFFVDPKEVEERVISVLRNVEKITDKSKITSTSHFTKDLGLDRYVTTIFLNFPTVTSVTLSCFNFRSKYSGVCLHFLIMLPFLPVLLPFPPIYLASGINDDNYHNLPTLLPILLSNLSTSHHPHHIYTLHHFTQLGWR